MIESLLNIFSQITQGGQMISSDRFVNAAFALLLSFIAGFITGPKFNSALPFFWIIINSTFGRLADRLDNIKRKPSDLLFRGFFVCILMIVFVAAVGFWLNERLLFLPQSRIFEIIIISFCLSTGSVIHHGMRLFQVMKGAKMSEGTYLTLARTSRFDLSTRDDFTLTRVAAEVFVRLFDKACVAPLLWYVLGGIPVLFIYAALSALVWKNGYDGSYENLGKMALVLEKLMGFVPSLFSAAFLAVTTLIVPYSKPMAGLKSLIKSNSYNYYQGGAPLMTISETLNMTLGGDMTNLNGRKMKRDWSGPKGATAQLEAEHLKRVLYMIFIADIFLMGSLFSGSLWAELYF